MNYDDDEERDQRSRDLEFVAEHEPLAKALVISGILAIVIGALLAPTSEAFALLFSYFIGV